MAERPSKPQEKPSGPPKKRAEKIGQQLRTLYDNVANEDVPDDFLRLLEQADKASPSSSANS